MIRILHNISMQFKRSHKKVHMQKNRKLTWNSLFTMGWIIQFTVSYR